MRFCDNPECVMHEYETHLRIMYIDIPDSFSYQRKRVVKHEYMDMFGASWYFCDTCHNACQMLDHRTRRV